MTLYIYKKKKKKKKKIIISHEQIVVKSHKFTSSWPHRLHTKAPSLNHGQYPRAYKNGVPISRGCLSKTNAPGIYQNQMNSFLLAQNKNNGGAATRSGTRLSNEKARAGRLNYEMTPLLAPSPYNARFFMPFPVFYAISPSRPRPRSHQPSRGWIGAVEKVRVPPQGDEFF
jgi:hypothetical protein